MAKDGSNLSSSEDIQGVISIEVELVTEKMQQNMERLPLKNAQVKKIVHCGNFPFFGSICCIHKSRREKQKRGASGKPLRESKLCP